jgi:hypothetical protein
MTTTNASPHPTHDEDIVWFLPPTAGVLGAAHTWSVRPGSRAAAAAERVVGRMLTLWRADPVTTARAATVVGVMVAATMRHGAPLTLELARRLDRIVVAVSYRGHPSTACEATTHIEHELLMAGVLTDELFVTETPHPTGTAIVAHIDDVAAPTTEPTAPRPVAAR